MTERDTLTHTHTQNERETEREREREREGENERGRTNNTIKKLSHTEVRKPQKYRNNSREQWLGIEIT